MKDVGDKLFHDPLYTDAVNKLWSRLSQHTERKQEPMTKTMKIMLDEAGKCPCNECPYRKGCKTECAGFKRYVSKKV